VFRQNWLIISKVALFLSPKFHTQIDKNMVVCETSHTRERYTQFNFGFIEKLIESQL